MGGDHRRRARRAGIALFIAVVAGACSREEVGDIAPRSSGAPRTLDGRTFLSRSVTGRELVPKTRIQLTFDNGQIGATAGCNSLGAPYMLRDGMLDVTAEGMATTEMGCDPPRHAQDEWLADFLMSSPRAELDDNELTLVSGTTTIELVDREVADPDRPLAGTTWRVDTILSGDTASSVPEGGVVTLRFPSETTFRVDAKDCTSATGTMTVRGGTITFDDFAVDDVGCPSPWAETLRVLQAGEATYTIDAARLTLQAGDVGIGAVAGSS